MGAGPGNRDRRFVGPGTGHGIGVGRRRVGGVSGTVTTNRSRPRIVPVRRAAADEAKSTPNPELNGAEGAEVLHERAAPPGFDLSRTMSGRSRSIAGGGKEPPRVESVSARGEPSWPTTVDRSITTRDSGRIGAGVGLKQHHVEHALAARDPDLWFEVHTENYMVAGGPRLAQLRRIRETFPVSFHGVGASLGGPAPPEPRHLSAVRRLVDEFDPVLVSEHAVWSSADGVWFADLLPLPRTGDALRRLVEGVDRYQEAIGRRILIENPTNYLTFVSEMDEPDFLNEAAVRTGCGLLLDVNNVYLSARNCGIDPERYIRSLPADRIEEIHIAGFEADESLGESLLIDTHAAPVSEAVWHLLDDTLAHLGPRPVLLERDGKLPPFETLMEERRLAVAALSRQRASAERAIA